MLGKLKKAKIEKSEQGFTIIEIMIVLVIAGLILLIVFLAVPALQRNARNTQRKNDIGNLASGLNNFINDNNGQFPTTIAVAAGGQTTISGGAGTVSVNDIKLGYYGSAAINVTVQPFASAQTFADAAPGNNFLGLLGTASAAAPPPNSVSPDSFAVTTGATCGGTMAVGSSGLQSGSSRGFTITYELEQSGSTATAGGVPQCQAS